MKITKQTHFALLPWRTARRPGARPTQHGVPFLAPAARKGLRALPGDAPLAVAEHSSVEISPDNPRKNLTLPGPFQLFIVINLRVPSSRSLRLPLPGSAPTEHEGYRANQNYGTHYAGGGVNVNPSFQDFSKGASTAGRLSAATLSRARKSAGIRAGVGCFGT